MDKLYEILEKSGASDFLIRETTTCSREAFFIGQKLDMGTGQKGNCHTFVTVYVDSEDGKFRGSATKEIHPTSTPEEMEKEIQVRSFCSKICKEPLVSGGFRHKSGRSGRQKQRQIWMKSWCGSSRPFRQSGQRPTRKSIPMRFL